MDPNLLKFLAVAEEDVSKGRLRHAEAWDRSTAHAWHYLNNLDPAISPHIHAEMGRFKNKLTETLDGIK